jgi:hypothetical protein
MHVQKHPQTGLGFHENVLRSFYILDPHALPYPLLSSLFLRELKNLLGLEQGVLP